MEKPFVFVIGFNKCATRAIHLFFHLNEFPAIHWNSGRLAAHMVLNSISGRKIFEGYDRSFKVFSDLYFINDRIVIEGNQYFRAMDRDYPGSFFIYNTRSMDKWVESRLKHAHVGGTMIDRFKKLYGTDDTDVIVRHWIDSRTRLEAELDQYFGASERLLTLNVESEDPAGQIARFLRMDLDLNAWVKIGETSNRPPIPTWTGTGPKPRSTGIY